MRRAAAHPTWARLPLAYLELTKPRIVFLVLMTGAPALLTAAHGIPQPSVFWGGLVGTALAAASAASFNHYFDRDIDGLMVRTAARPLPAGVLAPVQALIFGLILAALAWGTLISFTNPLAAVLGMLSILYYVVIYTLWLKRRTPENIVIGGAAGASTPLIAWAAVTGHVGYAAIVQSSIVFLWTPPHFWSLALYRSEDYQAAGVPMLPVTHGAEETRKRILVYAVVLVAATLVPGPLGFAGWIYTLSAAALGTIFLQRAWQLFRSRAERSAVGLFRFSILYLFLLFTMMTIDAAVRAFSQGPPLFGAR